MLALSLYKGDKMDKYVIIVAYIIKCFNNNKKHIGKTILNKMLWFIHREYLYQYKEHLTDTKFIRNDYGPVPKKHKKLIKDMLEKGLIVDKSTSFGSDFYIVENSFNFDILDEKIKKIIIFCVNKYREFNANELSEISHDGQWHALKNGDTMLVEDVFLRDLVPVDPKEIEKLKAKYL